MKNIRYTTWLQAMKAVIEDPSELEFVAPKLRNKKEIVYAAVNVQVDIDEESGAFQFAGNYLRSDRDFVLSIVRKDGLALQWADHQLRNDPEVVMAAIKQEDGPNVNCDSFQFASKELRNDADFVLAAVKVHAGVLQYASSKLKAKQSSAASGTGSAGPSPGEAHHIALAVPPPAPWRFGRRSK